MKQWLRKFIDQLDYGWSDSAQKEKIEMSEERATLLYVIDVFNKNLIEIDTHPVRKTREILDEFAKELVAGDSAQLEKVLFKFRQFFSHYRVDEYTYVRKTFDDFKGIIWDFVDQLSEDFRDQELADADVEKNVQVLKEAVEADSIDVLRAKSREFIDFYVSHNTRQEIRREKRLKGMKKNLEIVQKRLEDANASLRTDHLTGAFNRRSFDEKMREQLQHFKLSKVPCTLILLDIDHFKRINDTFGHDNGDFVLQELVRMLKEDFARDQDMVARIGGEEFAVILPQFNVDLTLKKVENAMHRIRNEVFVKDDIQIRFTVSMGIAQVANGESADQWLKRADTALYASKNGGRNRYTVAPQPPGLRAA